MSLFPFLSILVCLIGVLTLLLVGITLSSMPPDQLEAMLRGSELEAVKHDLDEEQRKKEELQRLIDEAELIRKALEEAKAQLLQMQQLQKSTLEGKDQLEADSIKILAEIKSLEEQIKTLTTEMADLLKQIAELEKELKDRKEPPPAAEVRIVPTGTGKGLIPTFVECNATGIVIYEGAEPTAVPYNAMAANPQFALLCERISNQAKTHVITFLVRPDGIQTYQYASALARQRWAPNGKLPAPGQGKIDLSMFKPK
ncbi:MAG: hypothetical protein IT440_01700 [Phycisphaeraceae bacterium]|nr:hypothetical protein [Phycisphaeraceae bacterium]